MTGRIVVGVDGSADSRAALRWAIHQAEMTGSAVEVVCAWEHAQRTAWTLLPTNYGTVPVPFPPERNDERNWAEETIAEVMSEVAGPNPVVPVTAHPVLGHPSRALLDAAKGADLLVLGRRGYGGFVGLRLGSISRHCVEHAPCGVVVIAAEPEESTE
ncbi:MAG TPA: universal stress protein [Pseudonocardiaceae bacterium]